MDHEMEKDMKGFKFAATLLVLFSCAGCAPDLIVKDLSVNWDPTNKKTAATIANVGKNDAGDFLVYTNGDEAPTSQIYRPQIVQTVPRLKKRR